jgi:hypothetical protein
MFYFIPSDEKLEILNRFVAYQYFLNLYSSEQKMKKPFSQIKIIKEIIVHKLLLKVLGIS